MKKIILIGGPPKCGKTTLAKTLSKKLSISLVSTDSLQCSIIPHLSKKEYKEKFPTSNQKYKTNDEKYSRHTEEEIIKAYRQQAKTVQKSIEMFMLCDITDGGQFIMEGYHIEPEFVSYLKKKYPGKIKGIFLTKTDRNKFIKDIKKSSTHNDWIIENTKNKDTFVKIASMICEYSQIFETESKKYNLDFINMDNDFIEKINNILFKLKKT